jgi:uncharacterized protein
MESDPPKTTRVFIDSSVLIAAAISATGAARELILRGLRGEVQLVISSLVLEETERNLRAKVPAAIPAFEIFQQALAASLVRPTKAAVLRAAKLIAVKDAPIVAAAQRARVPYLASFDQKDLHQHKRLILARFGVEIVFPTDILEMLREGQEETR